MNESRMLQLLLIATLKGTLVLATAWAFLWAFKQASASIRHWICTIALASAIAIPILSLAVPVWSVPIATTGKTYIQYPNRSPLSVYNPSQAKSSSTTPTSKSTNHDSSIENPSASNPTRATVPTPAPIANAVTFDSAWATRFLFLWVVGSLIVLIAGISQARHLSQITRRAEQPYDPAWHNLCKQLVHELKIRRQVNVLISDKVIVPLTWGLWQPYIVLPSAALTWSSERQKIVLQHELAHIVRWDYLMQWAALLSCAINWFNPLAWKIARLLSEAREQACDDRVLEWGNKNSDYASHLLEISHGIRQQWVIHHGVLAMGQHSNLANRIRRILDSGQNRSTLTRRRIVLGLVLVASVLLPLSTFQLSRTSAQDNSTVITVAFPQWVTANLGQNEAGESVVAEFESAHPGVKVVITDGLDVPDPADGLEAYFTAVEKAASSSDLVLTTTEGPMAVVPQGTRAGYFLDLMPLINSDTSLNVDDFYPAIWRTFQWDNGMWAMPYAADMALITYDKEMFDAAGIPYPSGEWTLNDFADAVRKLTIKDANGATTQTGFTETFPPTDTVLWQALVGNTKLYDDSSIPSQPRLDTPEAEALLDTFHQLQQEGTIGGVPVKAGMYVESVSRNGGRPDYTPHLSLMPGNTAGIVVEGFAISAGSKHPDLAYELAKYLTTKPGDIIFGIPARKNLPVNEWFAPFQSIIDQGLANGITYSDMRFTSYLRTAWRSEDITNAKDAAQKAELALTNDLKAADAKKDTFTLDVNEPTIAVLEPGKIALNFDLMTSFDTNANRDQWDQVIQDFTASDPQVGIVNLDHNYKSLAETARSSDCFYLPSNQVPMVTGDTVLDLSPFLNADPTFDSADLIGNTWASVQRDSKVYALPINLEPLILQIDGKKFSAANIPAPANDWTIESFADVLRTLKDKTNGQVPYFDSISNGTDLLVLIADYGGHPLDYRTDPPTINFSDPATITAIQQVLDLAKNGYMSYTTLSILTTTNAALSATNAPSIYPIPLNGFIPTENQDADANRVVLFPMGHEFTGLAYRLGTAYISTQAQSPDGCYRFISTLAKHPELFPTMPVRHSLLTSSELAATTKPDVLSLYNQLDMLLQNPNTIPFPTFDKGDVSVSNFLLQNWLFEAFDAYVTNGSDLSAGLQTAEAYAKAYQECTTNLPPITLAGPSDPTSNTLRAYVECADRADNRLKSFLDPMVSS